MLFRHSVDLDAVILTTELETPMISGRSDGSHVFIALLDRSTIT
jgi:hypothetical protein